MTVIYNKANSHCCFVVDYLRKTRMSAHCMNNSHHGVNDISFPNQY